MVTSKTSAATTAVVPIAAVRSCREPPHSAYPMLKASIPATSAMAALRVPLRNTIVRLSAMAAAQNARHRCSGGIEDNPPALLSAPSPATIYRPSSCLGRGPVEERLREEPSRNEEVHQHIPANIGRVP